MDNLISMVNQLLASDRHDTAYLTGYAGTGKTTELIDLCEYLHEQKIPFVVCAYTHKACEVLALKFPNHLVGYIRTLDSFLRKRPGINDQALKTKHVSINYRSTVEERPKLLIVDEFSMVGENDRMAILDVQDPIDEKEHVMKVLMVGDPYQLPPIGDRQSVVPRKPFWRNLTVPRRTDKPDIQHALTTLVNYIEGVEEPAPLASSENLIRGVDLAKTYAESVSEDKIILAWTNEAVQRHNREVQGYDYPRYLDTMFCTTDRTKYVFISTVAKQDVTAIVTHRGSLELGTKYKTLEHLKTMPDITFMKVENTYTSEQQVIATCFGMLTFKQTEQNLTAKAVAANKAILEEFGSNIQLDAWSRDNPKHHLSVKRKKAWRDLLTFKDSVMQLDFCHAMTVHKSQGSTYEEVYVDTDDLHRCADMDFTLYLKLLYVAVSRAAKRVYTS